VTPDARLVGVLLTVGTSVPLLVFAGYVWHLAGRVRRAGQYPPPGLRVIRPMAPLTGSAATRRMHVLAGTLAAAAVMLVILLWRLLFLLTRPRSIP
jgi:hypothetical protein